MLPDISNKEDIKLLIDKFYSKLLDDEGISHFFTDHMNLALNEHMPIMYSFWESMIFDQGDYKGNPMVKHLELSKKSKIKKEHFDIWINTWKTTIQETFKGPNAEKAISKAQSIRSLMEYKINQNSGNSSNTIL